jgi:AraC-type DNA-binding domain-containing proteins
MVSKTLAGEMQDQQYFLWGTMENTVSGYAMIIPPQDKFMMLYVRGGTGEITQGENSRQAERGDLFFLRFGLTFLVHSTNEPVAFTSFLVSGPCKNFPFSRRIDPGTDIEQQMEDLTAAGPLSFPGAAVPQLSMLLSFLKSSEIPQRPAKHPGSVHTDMLKLILDTRFAEPLHLEQFAEELHLNKYKLVKDFKAYYGLPPIEYLIKRRIQEACRLLQETDKSVTTIGAEVGMDNTPYFIRTFKNKIGCTPFAYRKSLQCLYTDKK